MNSQLWWYAARAGGIVAWGMAAASVLWGLALSTRVLGPRPRPNWLLDMHRFLGGAAVVFTAIHVASIVGDSYVHFGLAEILVPFVGDWHPMAVAWGIVSAYLLVAIQVTSMLRRSLSKRAWRMTHFLSFPLFVTATIHGLSAGSDRTSLPLEVAMMATSSVVLLLTALRVQQARRRPAQRTRVTSLGGTAGSGPARPGREATRPVVASVGPTAPPLFPPEPPYLDHPPVAPVARPPLTRTR